MTISNNLAKTILAAIADHLHVDPLELRSSRGTGSLQVLRGQAVWVMRKLGLSWQEVGILFNRNFDVIRSICSTAEERLADPAAVVYKQEVEACLALARTVAEEAKREGTPVTSLVPSEVAEVARKEPPILVLLKTGRDELRKKAQDLHRLSMLFDAAIIRLEAAEEQPITINADRSSEEIK